MTKSSDVVQKIAEMTENLEPMPQIAAKVMEVVGNPDTSCEMLAAVIARDPVIASKVLSLSNTPYYRRVESITSLNMAVMILGFGTIQSLVLTISVGILFGRSRRAETISRIWEHSVATALISEILGKRLTLPNQERYYIAGLLHDVGKLVFCKNFPDRYREVLRRSHQEGVPAFEAEGGEFGFDHTQVGKAVLEKWLLPEDYHGPAANHHHLENIEEIEIISPLVHVADCIAHDIVGHDDDTTRSPDPAARQRLGLEEADIMDITAENREVILENLHLMVCS